MEFTVAENDCVTPRRRPAAALTATRPPLLLDVATDLPEMLPRVATHLLARERVDKVSFKASSDGVAIRDPHANAGVEWSSEASSRCKPIPHDRVQCCWHNLIGRLFNKLKS